MNRIPLLLAVNFFFLCQINAQEKVWTKQDTCLSYLENYSLYWKKDKLGKNGARELIADFILKQCDLKGEKWADLFKSLGEANVTFYRENKRVYRYRLNYQSADIKEIGTMLLNVEVDNAGIITSFSIVINDG